MSRSHDNPNAQVAVVTPITGVIAAPSPWGGHVIDVTLIADATLPNPVYASSEKSETGDRLTVIVRQTAGGAPGWVLTLDTAYKAAQYVQTMSDAGVDVLEFVFDGTVWLSSAVKLAVVA